MIPVPAIGIESPSDLFPPNFLGEVFEVFVVGLHGLAIVGAAMVRGDVIEVGAIPLGEERETSAIDPSDLRSQCFSDIRIAVRPGQVEALRKPGKVVCKAMRGLLAVYLCPLCEPPGVGVLVRSFHGLWNATIQQLRELPAGDQKSPALVLLPPSAILGFPCHECFCGHLSCP
jgi:hypothetical protein